MACQNNRFIDSAFYISDVTSQNGEPPEVFTSTIFSFLSYELDESSDTVGAISYLLYKLD